MLLAEQTNKGQLQLNRRVFEFGDKCGRLLAFLARPEFSPISIARIKNGLGVVVEESQEILQAFELFYADLYQSQGVPGREDMENYLSTVTLPVLERGDSEHLDRAITVEEIEGALKTFANHKSPGLDGFPVEWYRLYAPSLLSRLLKVFNTSRQEGELPTSMREALIVLLPKPGKNPEECESYRPISLINTDVKILAKVLALRLQSVVTKLVGSDQTGFMPGR